MTPVTAIDIVYALGGQAVDDLVPPPSDYFCKLLALRSEVFHPPTPEVRFPDGQLLAAAVVSGRPAVRIRPAEAADVERLTELVHASAAYRGRYASIVDGYRVTPEYLDQAPTWVAVDAEGSVRGWVSLQLEPLEIDMMFVADEDHGRGIGRALVVRLLDDARRRGPDTVRVVAHPDAEGFYRRLGAQRVGTVPPAPPRIAWERPELRFILG